jgi:predicted O-linked N-acetylglucosamine transferase (SPINDLY family)
MTIDLNKDQKLKLKTLFEKKNYSKFESEVEKLGNLENLPLFLLMGYAGSKAINPKSKKEDFLKSTVIFEKIYLKDKTKIEVLYNLIISSLKAETTLYVLPHLIEKYQNNEKDLKIIEGIARCHFLLGNMDLSVKFFKKLVELNSVSTIDGGRLTYLASMNYPSGIDQKNYFQECSKLGEKFNKYFKFSNFSQSSKKNDKIRVGFVSGDLRTHSVDFFLRDVISEIDKKKFQCVAFSNLEKSRHDEVTNFYKQKFDEWYDIIDHNDEALIEFIRSLKIDILFDLNGFTFGNRINIFAARCAKIQIEWLGYNNSVGLDNMDYLIADKNLINKEDESLYKEKVLYLPNIWNSMSKPESLPNVNDLPFENDNIFKYGSFNSFKKISNDTVEVWSKILNNSNNCQLYLKNSGGYIKEVYDNLLEKFKKKGVDPKKIIFLGRSSKKEFLKDYNKIDLALDTFPYTGVTTTFQSYLMGVPVLTMKGFNINSRCGESINMNLEMREFIANNYNDYFKKALLFQDKNKLKNLRKSLRGRVLSSNLFNTEKFTRDFSELLNNLV